MSVLRLFCLVFSLLLLSACSLFGPAAEMDDGPVPERALRIAETARAQIGVRYARGGVSPRMGFDCSGLVYYAFRKNGIQVRRKAAQQADEGRRVSAAAAREGDVVVFRTGLWQKHTGVCVGNGEFVHAPGKGRRVEKERLDAPHWQDMLISVRRIVR